MSAFDDLVGWIKEFKDRPTPVSYVVLDPMHMGAAKDDTDGLGRRYLQCSPAILDSLKFVKVDGVERPSRVSDPLGVFGIPVYRLEDMRPDWPGLGIDHAPSSE